MGEKKFTDLVWEEDKVLDGKHAWIELDNGYVVSVVQNMYSYGNRNGEGLYEVAALCDDEVYSVPGEDDQVRGWLDESGVDEFIGKVEALPAVPKKGTFKSIRK